MSLAPAERRAWVIYSLALRGTTLAEVARRNGVTRQCIYAAFQKPYPKMELLIAEALGTSPDRIWPERYPAARNADPGVQRRFCLHDNTEGDKASSPPAADGAHRCDEP